MTAPIAALTSAALVAAAPAFAQTVNVETARGLAEVPQQPDKVVVYDVAAIDTLVVLSIALPG